MSRNKNMSKLNVLTVCRLCLASGEAEKLGELTNHLTYIISTCFSVKICMSSGLTNKICQVCSNQLEHVYKYRKTIIKNEIILLKKCRENITNSSAKLSLKNLLVDYDDRVTDGVVRINFNEFDVADVSCNESDTNESNIAVHEEIHSKIEKQVKDNALETQKNTIEPEEKEQSSSSDIQGIWRDLKIDDNQLDNFKVVETNIINDLDDSLRDQHDTKSKNVDVTERRDVKSFTVNKNGLQQRKEALPIIHPMSFELLNQRDTTIETDKENTDFNNFTTTDLSANDSTFIFNDQGENAGVIINQDQFCTTNMDRKFMCLTCLKIFKSQKELSIHYKTAELSKSAKETSKKYKEPNMVKVLKNDSGKTIFKCGVCSKVFENKALVIKHSQIHKVERPFLCNLCSRTYKTVADILRHGVVHNGFKFVCSYECGYTTVHMGALREHVKRHKKEFKYKCDKCGKCFQVKTWYEQHQNVHDKVRPFVCKLCGQAFSMARYLTAHRANVHPQSSKVKRYKCVHCALPCDSRKSLVMHMKQTHGLKTDCLCDVCGQILPDQQKLILHKSVHEATRKFSCRFCKKTFNKKDHQTVHEKIHTGERLNCNNCSKSFTQRCSLRRHIKRYHQGDQQSL